MPGRLCRTSSTASRSTRNQARPYLPVTYTQIDQMIEDNNKSRVHLGVHWNFDCEFGSRSGARIAEAAYRNAYKPYR